MHTINVDELSSNLDKQQYIKDCIKDNSVSLQFEYSSHFKNAKILRDFVRIIFSDFHLAEADVSRFVLACDEMNNNAIEYGSKNNEKNLLRIDIKKQNTIISINIEAQDTGNGKASKTAEEMEQYKQQRTQEDYGHHKSIRGRGLFLIIISIVDELYFKNTDTGGLIVGFKKDLLIN